ncbi:MAG: hypothetical protein UY99_C0007G0023 [Parcubacteria group bacterium GW2011_GWA1_59_11]|nr:MAG: hypothetical protein UY99_C0007G0023 [Parcubacteria group bacterium GW2011_GWA1_59_11]
MRTVKKYYFLPEDIAVVEKTVGELHRQIKELGKEQGEAARQSTENFGHDDACQEAVFQQRRVVTARLNNLQEIVNHAEVVRPKGPFDAIRIGATVELSDGRILRVGSYMLFAEHEAKTISYNSPLGRALLKKKEGEEVHFQDQTFTIVSIK